MYCNNCGNEISEGAKFCRNCGAPVEQPQDQYYGESQNAGYTDSYEEKKPAKNQGLVIGLILMFVACIGAGLYFSGTFEKKNDQNNSGVIAEFTTEEETTEIAETTEEETEVVETTTEKKETQEDKDIKKGREKEGKGTIKGNTYTNLLFGFKFTAPSGFQIQERSGNIDMMAISSEGSNVNVIVTPKGNSFSISTLIEQAKGQLESQLKNQGFDVKVGETGSDKLAGEKYVTLDYDMEMSGVKMKVKQYYREYCGYVIIITFTDTNGNIKEMKNGFKGLY
ncbi:MAG: zinc-ribbon domain-containing protein [Eubacterium sp.]|nr:zinc-ribbon domain-containing protein [Eubacterium sp.]